MSLFHSLFYDRRCFLSKILLFLLVVFFTGLEIVNAQLPQDHAYQETLRDYLGTLSEADFDVPLAPLEVEESYFENDEEIYKAWLIWGQRANAFEFPPHKGVRVNSGYFTLDSIESGGNVNMSNGRNGWISALTTAFFADWNYEGNPHYDSRAVKLRAFVAAAVDMMMQDQAHDNGDQDRSDFLGGQLNQWAYPYGVAKDVLPESVKEAFEAGLIRMFEKLESWGPTSIHADMDTRAMPGVLYVAQNVESEDLTQRAYDYIDRLLDKHFQPPGYIDHGGAYDASYNGISLFHLSWAAYMSDYKPIVDALKQMLKLKAYMTLTDPDGDRNTTHHSNSSSPSDAADDQWSRDFRNSGLAWFSDEGISLLKEDDIVDSSSMYSDLSWKATDYINSPDKQGFTQPDDSEPSVWQSEHWTKTHFTYPALYYREGQYDRLQSASNRLKALPFERDENFVESFSDKFLSVRQSGYGTILFNDRLSWWTSEGQTEELNGFGGGNISAFWTPSTGTVLMGVARGTRFGGHDLSEWNMWPVHALSGETPDGKGFSSGLQRHPEANYELERDPVTVTMNGDLTNIWSDPRDGLSGEANYRRVFKFEDQGVRVTTSVIADGSNNISQLYEILPVFRRNASDQSSNTETQIQFEVDGSWQSAGTTMQTVSRIRLQRFDGEVIIEFIEPARVKLSPEDFFIDQSGQSGAQIRNIMIDMLDGSTSLDDRSIEYKIYNPDASPSEGDNTPPNLDVSSSVSESSDEEIVISAEATDNSGISEIQIYLDGNMEKQCADTNICEVTVGPLEPGTYSYYAKAIDDSENQNEVTSGEKTFTVDESGEVGNFSFELEDNYPNPFNPSTNIVYSIDDNTNVTLEIYNSLGQQVSTLVNESQTPGEYTVTFNAEGLASGLYFYRLNAGKRIEVKKMLLIK